MAAGAVFAYREHPLAMDEFAPFFQAGAFARGHLSGQIPPEFLPRLIPETDWFLKSSPSGQMVSVYWPGFALLLTPFMKLGCPWLLNPLIGGASLLALWQLARKLWPETQAAGWAVLFAASSPTFIVNALSYYSMSAHLLASIVFALLLLDPTAKRLLLAGLLGSFALILHNPLPHTLFALPWIVWLALKPRRIRNLALLAVGYLPLSVSLGYGWLRFENALQVFADQPSMPYALGSFGRLQVLLAAAFSVPSIDKLAARGMNLVELALWATPFLLPLACIGAVKLVRETAPRLLLFSALVTLVCYFFVPFDQGHGWGYRYFHSAWFVLPLFAAALVSQPSQAWIRSVMLPAVLFSCVLGTGLRAYQVRTFMDAQLAQIPSLPNPGHEREVVFVRSRGYYMVDLVQNDPFMGTERWILLSLGDAADTHLAKTMLKGGRLISLDNLTAVWRGQRASAP
jgi:hypothetical protein